MRLLMLLISISVIATAYAGEVVEMSTRVTGNQEQPKILYIVPWQAAESSDALLQALSSQSLDMLEPVAPDAFRRELLLRQQFKQVSGENAQSQIGH